CTDLGGLKAEASLRFWISGPAEDGYESTLERILERAEIPVTVGRAPTSADAYAASDALVLPSTWEGFGNPTIESIVARRPLAAFPYPVLAEIRATGVRFFSTADAPALARFLREPEAVQEQFYEVTLRRAALSYALSELPRALDELFTRMGWRW